MVCKEICRSLGGGSMRHKHTTVTLSLWPIRVSDSYISEAFSRSIMPKEGEQKRRGEERMRRWRRQRWLRFIAILWKQTAMVRKEGRGRQAGRKKKEGEEKCLSRADWIGRSRILPSVLQILTRGSLALNYGHIFGPHFTQTSEIINDFCQNFNYWITWVSFTKAFKKVGKPCIG